MRAPSKYHGRRRGGLVLPISTNWPSRNTKMATTMSVFANLMSDENVIDYNDDNGHDEVDGGNNDGRND